MSSTHLKNALRHISHTSPRTAILSSQELIVEFDTSDALFAAITVLLLHGLHIYAIHTRLCFALWVKNSRIPSSF